MFSIVLNQNVDDYCNTMYNYVKELYKNINDVNTVCNRDPCCEIKNTLTGTYCQSSGACDEKIYDYSCISLPNTEDGCQKKNFCCKIFEYNGDGDSYKYCHPYMTCLFKSTRMKLHFL